MQILSISTKPVVEIPFLNAGKSGEDFYEDRLPVLIAEVDHLPGNLDAIVATADLQGRERFEECTVGPPRLLGEVLPRRLSSEVLPNLGLTASRSGVLLGGDFFTVPTLDRRGGSGDVTSVWQAFGADFAWVAGVPGNHDTFGEAIHPSWETAGNLHYLHNDRRDIDGLRIAGMGGIIGNPRRPHRQTDVAFVENLRALFAETVDVLLLHDGPDVTELGLRGSSTIRSAIQMLYPHLIVRGHAHWKQPLAELAGGIQVLNVNSRVVIIRASPAGC